MKVISGVFFIASNNTFRTIKKEHKSIWYVNFKIWSEANIWRYMHSYCNEKDTTIIMIHFFLKPYEVENSILWIPLEWVTHIWPSFALNHAMHSAHTITVMPMVLILDGNSEKGAHVSRNLSYLICKAFDKIESSHKSDFLNACVTCSELPSNISTMPSLFIPAIYSV